MVKMQIEDYIARNMIFVSQSKLLADRALQQRISDFTSISSLLLLRNQLDTQNTTLKKSVLQLDRFVKDNDFKG